MSTDMTKTTQVNNKQDGSFSMQMDNTTYITVSISARPAGKCWRTR
ncbi:hypothetical protein AALB64_04070 [Lachnospiraceae bacterium 45-P1]